MCFCAARNILTWSWSTHFIAAFPAALVRGSARCCMTDSTGLPAIPAHLVAGVLPEVAASSLLLARGKERYLPSPLTSGNLSKFVSGNISEARSDLI